jgi:hypothetical protein
MALTTESVLAACDRLCGELPAGRERAAAQAEIDALRAAPAELLLTADADACPGSSASVRAIKLLARVRATADAPTEVLLWRWREAEAALAAAEPGTFVWLVTCLAVQDARDGYHARTKALGSTGPRDRSTVDSMRP